MQGDIQGREFTTEELKADGVKENVIRAYRSTRRAVKASYNLLNDARQQVRVHQNTVDKWGVQSLQRNPFTEIIKIDPAGTDKDGRVLYLVAYKKPKTWMRTQQIDEAALQGMKNQSNIYVKRVEPTEVKGVLNVTYEEKAPDLHELGGYVPHFFHEYFAAVENPDGTKTVIGSGRTAVEAAKVAENYMSEYAGVKMRIFPKGFTTGMSNDETMRAATVGDEEYLRMLEQVQEYLSMSYDEAKEFLTGKVKTHGRHRFFWQLPATERR